MAVRDITSRGAEFPAGLALLKTYDSAFSYDAGQPQGGLDLEQWNIDGFPNWHYDKWFSVDGSLNDVPNPTLQPHQQKITVPTSIGNRTVVLSKKQNGQTLINGEFSYLASRHEFAEIGEDLVTLIPGNKMRLRAIETPASFREKALCVLKRSYEITAASTTQITVKGEKYTRRRPATDGSQERGVYRGLNRYMRDELGTGPATIDSWKRIKHGTGVIVLPTGTMVRYTQIDENATDPLHSAGIDTSHTIHLQNPLSSSDVPAVGARINVLMHAPNLSPITTLFGSFAQKYGVFDLTIQFADHSEQFTGPFDWPNSVKVYSSKPELITDWEEGNDDIEHDYEETPGVNTIFHNAHDPTGQMLDYAQRENLQPVMTHPEWQNAYNQQHQVRIADTDPDYVDPTTEHTVRLVKWPPGNAAGKQADTVEWYVKTADGKFKFTGGNVMHYLFGNGIIDETGLILTHPVGGDFVSDMNFLFNPGGQSANTAFPIDTLVTSFEAWQFPGQRTGGAGWPQGTTGDYPDGLAPTPNDVTGNSGTGIVSEDATSGTPDDTTFEGGVDIEAVVDQLPDDDGTPIPVKTKVRRNKRGWGIQIQVTHDIDPALGPVVDVLDPDGFEVLIRFNNPTRQPTADELATITVQAIETDPPDPARVVDPDSDAALVTPTGPMPDGASTGGDTTDPPPAALPTLTVSSVARVISGTTTGILQGQMVSIPPFSQHEPPYEFIVQADGTFTETIDASFDSLDGDTFLATVSNPNGPVAQASLRYETDTPAITFNDHHPVNGVNIINAPEAQAGISIGASAPGDNGKTATFTSSVPGMTIPSTTVSGEAFTMSFPSAEILKSTSATSHTITVDIDGKTADFVYQYHDFIPQASGTNTAYTPGQPFSVDVTTTSNAPPYVFGLEVQNTSGVVLLPQRTQISSTKPVTFDISAADQAAGWPADLDLDRYSENVYRNGATVTESISSTASNAVQLDFSNDVALGTMDANDWADVFGGNQWFSQENEFVSIGTYHGRRGMRVQNVASSVGTDRVNGAFAVDPGQSYRVKQSIYFEDTGADPWSYGDVQRGGKMGFGFRGGSAPDGNTPANDGMTSRLMWRDDNDDDVGEIEAYTYSSDQVGNSGDQRTFPGFDIPLNTWFDVEMEVTMNTSTAASDGKLKTWINGVLYLDVSNIRWFSAGTPQIDGLTWATFYGGNSSDWSPLNTTYQVFADVEYEKLA